ncbi:MEMAR_RS02690 family S-layer glycoprotein [Methanocorpusculum vombati]|uniref:PGF-CTERM sorting domain-containing protein n=1 Tax=Methanocorpusculum vombati TaxID=3002864 RepID=A0ABT4INH6_9EURY|nr:MEMAR_RS02690 family S-layer glycoprotein [Methanocorpusculum vombati]MCZ0863308.1 PGF-CTERM sorting domain-containing protein [Methanocorpusculum vombati]MDE2519864.1 MEMAR_RS02690 family S-layer glycoprotein [Methanocorpusculum sp.]MDE2533526.1 MEMAR_RS02690 family S-layer glycoprotein [Methanocorpusculum sp.]MDE2548064.1 MEMAR_RS02690 family S-layer glycoprotein [Methanocorpusculum sp.]
MKIMAVLAVLLISALFMGAVSAADNVTVTPNVTSVEIGGTVNFTVTNASLTASTTFQLINVTGTTPAVETTTPMTIVLGGGGANVAYLEWTPATLGTFKFNINTTTPTGSALNLTVPVEIEVTTPGNSRAVTSGNDAFVFEHIYVAGATKLTKYSDGTSPSVVNQISGDNGVFYLTEAVVNGQYGTYYSGAYGAGTIVNIWYPEISIEAELAASKGDSIDGKTINKDTYVNFLINAPKVGPAFATLTPTATAKIVFTTPANGKTTDFGYASGAVPQTSFNPVPLTSAQTTANPNPVMAGNDATAGTWTAQAEYTSPDAFSDYAKKSNTISFTLQSSTLTITAAKDSVVRSNPFTVTISGESLHQYAVYLETPSNNEVNPTLQGGQVGFQSTYPEQSVPAAGYTLGYYNVAGVQVSAPGEIFYDGYYPAIGGVFKTDASGKRTIQFNTDKTTEDKTYTVKVSDLIQDTSGDMIFDASNYDKVKVKVEKGAVTIAASGDGSYYIGDEIKLTGTNTDSTDVFLFITGQNLAENGILVKALPDKVAAKENGQPVAVKTDNTWEYKWDTSKIALDTGAYTIYATSRLTNGKSSEPALISGSAGPAYGTLMTVGGTSGYYAVKLSDSEYATVSVNLKQPFLSAVPSGTIVAKGDKIYIRGTAEGNPSALNIFIFGPNFFEPYSVSVEDDGSYEKKIEIPSTMSSNQYFVVVQHPMYNDVFDAKLVAVDNAGVVQNGINWPNDNYQWAFKTVSTTTGGDAQSFIVWGSANKLQGSQAADALTKMIDSANIDDIYTKLTFTVAEPWIKITNPGDKALGSKFTISGTTNLAVDDQVLVEVMSSSFSAVEKTSTSTTSGVSQATKVVAGEGADNAWSVEVDTTNWKLDEYTIKVNGIEVDVTTTTNFNIVEKVVTTTPTTAEPTGTTPTATTAKPTETPKTPGFGAFIALAGLGAVALLVLRRN